MKIKNNIENKTNFLKIFYLPVKYLKSVAGILIALLIMCIALSISSPYFLTTENILNVLRQVSVNAMLAFGMTYVILIGGIDLSVGSVLAFSSVITTGMIADYGMPVIVAVLIGLLLGAGLGFFNGFVIAKAKMAPFIVTLGMYSIARGFAYVYSEGVPIRVWDSQSFNRIGGGYIGPISYPIIYTIFFLILMSLILNNTKFGRHIYAVGGNVEAARFSGIKIEKITIIVFTISGFLSAFSGIVLSSRMYTGLASTGVGAELDAIAAVVLGGTSFSGGVGTIGGTIIGSLVIGVLNNGLNLLNVSSFWQSVVKGAVILLAVYIDTLRKKKSI